MDDCKTQRGSSSKGLWDCPRMTKYSSETQELLQIMMRESRLTNLQQRQINEQLRKGGTLPLTCSPTSSSPPVTPEVKISKTVTLPSRPQMRSAEQCSAGDNYTRERFRPAATRDLEKEKRRLQNILATGQEETPPPPSKARQEERREDEERDRFQEVLDEIEDRRQFLEEMTAIGRGKQYHHVITTEISQKIRELELLDKTRSERIRTLIMKQKQEKGENIK